ncbi:procollagen-lysine,2-oxoglutarate 5-dioxygenase isoform X2 [Aethina tumida]|uniref:procollagen-lysine,2-oxoglutarate 5-dioxygenase isoform X2 n=1 Tax=Aethina tumida TaxID=116153 RepID=UPI002147BDEC|nr:procollagen-lysine,2-oxoglutarate 5-dioxygenase isoform X2 [Aethina tumida]
MQVFVAFVAFCCAVVAANAGNDDVLVYTVATEETDGFRRYLESAEHFNIKPIVLGFGEEWKGGDDMRNSPGGGWKINLLKKALEPYAEDNEKIVIFTDGYDVVFQQNLDAIVSKFKETEARILFGAEKYCWPDKNLASSYPEVLLGNRFLNSGSYMGYAKELFELLTRETIEDTGDDQLFFTQAYLDAEFRDKNKFLLDHKSDIFQNINGAASELSVVIVENKDASMENYTVKNTLYSTEPSIIHGNGPSKETLNYLSNYIPNSWNSAEGCISCKRHVLNLQDVADEKLPVVLIGIFIETNTPFLEEFFDKVYNLEYPKNKLHLFIHNSMDYHANLVAEFVEKHGAEYSSVKQIKPEDGTTEHTARDLSLDHCSKKECDQYFSLDSVAHLDNPHTLKMLIDQNRTVVAPMLIRPGRAWSNFWGALTKDGYYARSNDYMDIVHNDKRGLWNVPFINNAYLVNASLLKRFDRTKLNYAHDQLDADMSFCLKLRNLDVFMYVSNRVDFGHLINAETYDITRAEPDMYQIFENEKDWEQRYIHPEYPENFNPENKPKQPCPDVYWFPIVTRKFTNALINMMETFGEWSSGSNEDKRLEGGYEAVPTRDIHMNQVGWERHWLHFLQKYVRPLQEHVFIGYFHDPPKSLMNFVVRYRPDEQPSLRPHHDSSTYTINIALNQVGVDYEGGGCRFIRYNCSVVDTKPGWILMHPGRLTHYHEGLRVTNGTRYIMISFVDP